MRTTWMWGSALLWLIPSLALAQDGRVRGRVIDSETETVLPGANVLVVELGRGTATGLDGTFEIADVPPGAYTLRATFVGYREANTPLSVRAGETVAVDLTLVPDYTGLEEVVVTGIASASSRARAEVAVSNVDADGLQERNSYQDVSQLMTGKVAGVSVLPASGNVAGGIRFQMRSSTGLNGQGQPVIYVDGVRIDNAEVEGFGAGGQGLSMLANLSPEDIASIDVLKGPAAAALYGTSGSNGVVLIKTKRGRLAGAGTTFDVTYKGTYGSNQQASEYDALQSPTPEAANAIFRDGLIAQHSLSVSGGSNTVRFYTSYDKRLEEGHIKNNGQDRQSFRANVEAFPMERVTVRANAGYTLNLIDRPQNDNNILGFLGNTMLRQPAYGFTDSVAVEALTDKHRLSRFLGSVEGEYSPLKNLVLRASVGLDATELRQDQSNPPGFVYGSIGDVGQRQIYNRRNEQYTYDFNARYSATPMRGLTTGTTVGFQALNRILRTSFIAKRNFQTELITNVGAGSELVSGNEDFTHAREAGIFAQQEFGVRDRLFVTLGIRRDFASAIGAEAPAVWYPKASMALRLDQFGFTPRAFTLLKPRVAYGETGQLPALLDGDPLRWAAEASGYGAGAVIDFIGNPEIQPERIRELEAGLDAELFGNLGFTFTYYYQWAKDSIIPRRLAPSTGLTASGVPFNVGDARGWGFESSLSYSPIRTRDYGLDLSLLWSFQDNEVVDIGDAQPIFDGFDVNVVKEGLPKNAFYSYTSVASFNADGSYAGPVLGACQDASENPVDCTAQGSQAARQFLGIPYPEHNGAFTVNVRFLRNFNVYVLTDWFLGFSVFNNTAFFQSQFNAHPARNIAMAQLGLLTDAQKQARGVADVQALPVGSPEYRAAAEVAARTTTALRGAGLDGNFIEEADFIKVREVSLGYDFTDLLRRSAASRYIRTARFTLSARNLFTSTRYSGADPEVNFDGARSDSRGTDFLTLPNPRVLYGTVTIGL